MNSTFSSCFYLKSEVKLINTNKIITLNRTFLNASNLKQIFIEDTTNVTEMKYTFGHCTWLNKINTLNTSNVTDMEAVLCGCRTLNYIPFTSLDNVTNLNHSFSDTSLTIFEKFNTNKVTTMIGTFVSCSKLKVIRDISFENVTNLKRFLYSAGSFEELPVFNIPMCSNLEETFSFCKYENIYFKNTDKVSIWSKCFSYFTGNSISGIDTSGAKNLTGLFYDCKVSECNFFFIPENTIVKEIFIRSNFNIYFMLNILFNKENNLFTKRKIDTLNENDIIDIFENKYIECFYSSYDIRNNNTNKLKTTSFSY